MSGRPWGEAEPFCGGSGGKWTLSNLLDKASGAQTCPQKQKGGGRRHFQAITIISQGSLRGGPSVRQVSRLAPRSSNTRAEALPAVPGRGHYISRCFLRGGVRAPDGLAFPSPEEFLFQIGGRGVKRAHSGGGGPRPHRRRSTKKCHPSPGKGAGVMMPRPLPVQPDTPGTRRTWCRTC